MGSRTWVKVYCDKWLEGTISEESISVRGVWIGLLALAGNGKYGDSGEIKAIQGVGFTDYQLTLVLKINPKMWTIARKRLLVTGRIEITDTNIISIVNWHKYQSEYERVSKYRPKVQHEVQPKVQLEIESRDRERDIREEEDKSITSFEPLENISPVEQELSELKGWGRFTMDDREWVEKFLVDYHGVLPVDVRECGDWWYGKAETDKKIRHSAGQWKTRLRNWLKRKPEFSGGGNGTRQGNAITRRGAGTIPEQYTPAPDYGDRPNLRPE